MEGLHQILERIDERLSNLERMMQENTKVTEDLGKVAEDLHQHTWILEKLSSFLQTPQIGSVTGYLLNKAGD